MEIWDILAWIYKTVLLPIRNFLSKYFFVVFIIIGLALLSVVFFNVDPILTDFCVGAGGTVLAAGVFAATLKSYQIAGIFRDELTDIIYDVRHLEKRKDIEEIWTRVTKVLYKQKFSDISDLIVQTIRNKYLPVSSTFYIDELKLAAHVTFRDADHRFIIVDDQLEFLLTASDQEGEVQYTYANEIRMSENDTDNTKWELEELYIDGVDRKAEHLSKIDKTYKRDALCIKFGILLKGSKKHKIRLRVRKVYDVEIDNTKTYTAKQLVKGMDLVLSHPTDLRMRFNSVGTPSEFADAIGANEGYLHKSYEGLIFPQQGYRIELSRK